MPRLFIWSPSLPIATQLQQQRAYNHICAFLSPFDPSSGSCFWRWIEGKKNYWILRVSNISAAWLFISSQYDLPRKVQFGTWKGRASNDFSSQSKRREVDTNPALISAVVEEPQASLHPLCRTHLAPFSKSGKVQNFRMYRGRTKGRYAYCDYAAQILSMDGQILILGANTHLKYYFILMLPVVKNRPLPLPDS